MTRHLTSTAVMRIYDPCFLFDEEPGKWPEHHEWDADVAVIDGIAGFIACPDCCADDTDLLALGWEQPNGADGEPLSGVSCNLCKDTGKVWVSL